VNAAAALLALFLASALNAQAPRPWAGRGATPRDAATTTASDAAGRAQAVAMVGLTVSDMDSSVAFYTRVLDFAKVTDDEVTGAAYESLTGVFGVRLRVVRLRLGDEYLQLTQYVASAGRPAPVDSRSNDRWFQHIAIVTTDIDAAYKRLRENKVRHASTGPQRLPDWNAAAGGIKAF